MQNIGFGDILFMVLILGVIHGIMYLVSASRKNASKSGGSSDPDPS